LTMPCCVCGNLVWDSISSNVTGFKVERRFDSEPGWSQIETETADVRSTFASCVAYDSSAKGSSAVYYRIRATSSNGDSAYSNEVSYHFCPKRALCPEGGEPDPVLPNHAPEIGIVSPANDDVVGNNLAITANAFDIEGNGTIVKVEFFANGNKLGEVTDAPYVFVWQNAASGTFSLTTIATDNAGASTTSSPISVMVDAAPSVSITSPANGAALNATSVPISALASDSDGSISKVEFFQGSTKLGEDTTAPYGLDWNNVAAGSYVLTAVATDNLGRATVSSPVTIAINAQPTVNITTPAGGTVFTAPTDLTINANASDGNGTISKVEFYQGTTLLGTDLTSPYSYAWSNVSAGSYSITAKATDNLGAVTTSNVVSISVNAKPSVSLTTPANGTSFNAPALVSINATAADSDGTISKVEFFNGTTLISTVTASPFSFTWSYVPAGTYTLSAKATDNLGASTTSSSVTISVTPNSVAIGRIAFTSTVMAARSFPR
jgi:hypothetical protein